MKPLISIWAITFILINANRGDAATILNFQNAAASFTFATPDGYNPGIVYSQATVGKSQSPSNSQSLGIHLEPGQGIILYGSAVAIGTGAAHIHTTVVLPLDRVTATLGALNVKPGGGIGDFDGFYATSRAKQSSDSQTETLTLDVIYDPKDDALIPVIQITASGNQAAEITLNPIVVTPLAELSSEALAELFSLSSTLFNTPTESPISIPTIFHQAIEVENLRANPVIEIPQGYTGASYSFGAVPTGSAVRPDISPSNGQGLTIVAREGTGLKIYGPAFDASPEPILLRCLIYTSGKDAIVTWSGLNVPRNGSLADFNGQISTTTVGNVSVFNTQWSVLDTILWPEDGGIIPCLQVVGTNSQNTTVMVDRFEAIPLSQMDAARLGVELGIALPSPTPTMTQKPTKTPVRPTPSGEWRKESYTIPNMQGEVRVLVTDTDGDGDGDILLSNSGSPDFDPSFQVMVQQTPGFYQRAEPLLGREWKPGIHQNVIAIPEMPDYLIDLRPASFRWSYQPPRFHTFHLLSQQIADTSVRLWQSAKEDTSISYARTYPWAYERPDNMQHPQASDARSLTTDSGVFRFVVSVGEGWSRYPYQDSSYPPRLSSTLFDSRIASDGTVLSTEIFTTGNVSQLDYLVTSMAFVNGRLFLIAETLNWDVESQFDPPTRGSALLERNKSQTLIRHLDWPEAGGGHLTVFRIHSNENEPQLLAVRQGSNLHCFTVPSSGPPQLRSTRDLRAPLVSGGYLLGHTSYDRFRSVALDDALAGTYLGELLPGDLNQDGITDLVTYCNGIQILYGTGDGTFRDPTIIDPYYPATDATIADLDGDGDNDLLASSGNELRFYFQNEPTSGAKTVILPTPTQGYIDTFAGRKIDPNTTFPTTIDIAFEDARRLAVTNNEIFVSDTGAGKIWRRSSAGKWNVLQDANGVVLDLLNPLGITIDGKALFICDTGHHRILRYNLQTKGVTLIAGNGEAGYSGDGSPAVSAKLNSPSAIAKLPDGTYLITDTGNRVVRVLDLSTGTINRWIPQAVDPGLLQPIALAIADDGTVYVTDAGKSRVLRIKKSEVSWNIETIAGGRFGPDGSGLQVGASLLYPEGLRVLPDGSLLIADTGNQRVLLYQNGKITWLAGSGVSYYELDGMADRVFQLNAPSDIVRLSAKEYLIAGGHSLHALHYGSAPTRPPEKPWETSTPTQTSTATPTNTPTPQLVELIHWTSNGHYYALYDARETWDTAFVAAQSVFDRTGYLATITSQTENNFLFHTFDRLKVAGSWLGGQQNPAIDESSPDSYGMGWSWITGEPWDYTYWFPGAPNNRGGNEDVLNYYVNGFFNDENRNIKHQFLVEWDHDPRVGPTGSPRPTPTFAPTPTSTPIHTLIPNNKSIIGPLSWSGNGHAYAVVLSPQSWETARQVAGELFDRRGYLAAVTSKAENDFLVAAFGWNTVKGKWLGGYQSENIREGNNGMNAAMGWNWVTGEPWDYTNWRADEPNDPNGGEDVLQFHSANPPGAWADANGTSRNGFVVEWEFDPLASPTPTSTHTSTPRPTNTWRPSSTPTASPTFYPSDPERELTFTAYIDGSDYVHIQGHTLWYVHRNFALPGLHNGNNYPTTVDSIEWFPTWPTGSIYQTNVTSNKFTGVDPRLPEESGYGYQLIVLQKRGPVTLEQTPSSANGYEAIVLLDDDFYGGAQWYSFILRWAKIDTETPTAIPTATSIPETPTALPTATAAATPTPHTVMLETPERIFGLGSARDLAISPDGRDFVCGGGGGAFLWSLETGELKQIFLDHISPAYAAAYSPDGLYVATGHWDGRVQLWNIETGERIRVYTGTTDEIITLVFSPDSTALAASTDGKQALIWNIAHPSPRLIFTGHTDDIYAIAFSPDGTKVLSGGRSPALVLWDSVTGEIQRQYLTEDTQCRSIDFSPDGTQILAVGSDSTARRIDLDSGQTIQSYYPATKAIFSPSGNRIATSYFTDHSVLLWNTATGLPIDTFESDTGDSSSIGDFQFAGNDDRLLIKKGNIFVRLWDIPAHTLVRAYEGFTDRIQSALIAPNGQSIVTSDQSGIMERWTIDNSESANPQWPNLILQPERAFKVSPDSPTNILAISPNGELAVSAVSNGRLIFWDMNTGEIVREIVSNDYSIGAPVFSPDGNYLVTLNQTTSYKTIAEVWDMRTRLRIKTIGSSEQAALCAAFSPDGNELYVGMGYGGVTKWRMDTGSAVFNGEFSTGSKVTSIDCAPDGRILTSVGNKLLQLWDRSGEKITEHSNIPNLLDYAAFAQGGNTIVAQTPNTVYILRASDGFPLATVPNQGQSVTVSPDGQSILTYGGHVPCRLWRIPE